MAPRPRRRNMSKQVKKTKTYQLRYPGMSKPPLWCVLPTGCVDAWFGGYSSAPLRWCGCGACRSNAFWLGNSGRSGSPINADAAHVRHGFAAHQLIDTAQHFDACNSSHSHMGRMRHIMLALQRLVRRSAMCAKGTTARI